jgi:hypothetical protein
MRRRLLGYTEKGLSLEGEAMNWRGRSAESDCGPCEGAVTIREVAKLLRINKIG